MRRELLILGIGLGFGLLVLPWLIFLVGHLALGPYSPGGARRFFADYLTGLVHGMAVSWVAALGPYIFLCFGRLFVRAYRGQ